MIHRRLLYNDGTVGGEPLNEPGRDGRGLIVRGRFLVLLETAKNSAKLHRCVAEEEFLRPLLAFSKEAPGSLLVNNKVLRKLRGYQAGRSYRGLTRPLPDNVHLLTLEKFNRTVLLRLEHQFAIDEDNELSKPVAIQLKGLFQDFTILSLTELNLSANMVKNKQKSANNWKRDLGYKTIRDDNYDVILNAMEIKTFKLDIEWKHVLD